MKNKSFIIVLLFFIFTTFSVAFSAKESEKFKVVIGSDEDIRISDVRLGVSIANVTNRTNDSKQYGVSDYQYYIISGSSIEFNRPSDTFILTIDEETLPVGYEVDENNVFIDEETNIYKFEVVRKEESNIFEEENYHYNFCGTMMSDENEVLVPDNRSYGCETSGRFNVYYETTITYGRDYALDVIDLIDDIESFFLYSGYNAPQTNNDGTLNIYIKEDLGGPLGDAPSLLSGDSWIKLDSTLFGITGDDYAFAFVLAHEYFHALCNANGGHALIEGSWFSEASATAAGLYFISESNIQSNEAKDFYQNRISNYYGHSRQSIEILNDINNYDNFLFPYYLIQEIGLDFVEELFTMQFQDNLSLAELDEVLNDMNTSFEEEYGIFCEYNLHPEENYDVISYYLDCFQFEGSNYQPTVHSIVPYTNSNSSSVSLDKSGCKYISMKAYEGNDGCSNYEGQIMIILPRYVDVKIYEVKTTSSGINTYSEINVSTTYSNILNGYVAIMFTSNLGSSYCEEIRYAIINTDTSDNGSSLSFEYNIVIRHRTQNIYEDLGVTFSSINNDLLFLKFMPYDTDLYIFDIATDIYSAMVCEIVIYDSSMSIISRSSFGNINLSGGFKERFTSMVCYLEAGNNYYIRVLNDDNIMNHTLTINRNFATLTPSILTPFGVSNQNFTKGDVVYTFSTPMTANYVFNFNFNVYGLTNTYFVIYKMNNSGLSVVGYDTLCYNYTSTTISVSLALGDTIYVGYYDYTESNATLYNLSIAKL